MNEGLPCGPTGELGGIIRLAGDISGFVILHQAQTGWDWTYQVLALLAPACIWTKNNLLLTRLFDCKLQSERWVDIQIWLNVVKYI